MTKDKNLDEVFTRTTYQQGQEVSKTFASTTSPYGIKKLRGLAIHIASHNFASDSNIEKQYINKKNPRIWAHRDRDTSENFVVLERGLSDSDLEALAKQMSVYVNNPGLMREHAEEEASSVVVESLTK